MTEFAYSALEFYNAGMADADYITTDEAATISGYHIRHLHRLLETGKVNGKKWGQAWMVDRASLLAYVESAQPEGVKRGPKGR